MLSALREYWKAILLLLFVFCATLFSYIKLDTFKNHRISQIQTTYNNEGWKIVDAKVLNIGNKKGNYSVEGQTVTLQYDDTVTGNQREVEQTVGMGYRVGDVVTLYVNKSSETIVKDTPNIPNPSPPSRDELLREFEKTDAEFLVNLGCGISLLILFLYIVFGLCVIWNVLDIIYNKTKNFSLKHKIIS